MTRTPDEGDEASDKFAFQKALRGRSDLSHTQFRVLSLLLTYAGADLAGAHPGIERLAEDACVSVMTVRRQLMALEQAGWVRVVGRHHSGHGRRGVAKVYALQVPDQVITQMNSGSDDQLITQMNSGSPESAVDNSGPIDHPDEQWVVDDQVFKSDDQVFISDDQVFTQMNAHHVNPSGQSIRSGAAAESTTSDETGDDQVHDDRQADLNGKAHKQPGSGLSINGDESPAELRLKQLRNKGHGPADAIRILLAEQRAGDE